MTQYLDLSRHCIQTELKRIHNQSVSRYFKAGPEEKARLEVLIEAVRRALETADFGRLRADYPALAGGSHQKAVLGVAGGHLVVNIGEDEIKIPTGRLS